MMTYSARGLSAHLAYYPVRIARRGRWVDAYV